MKIFLSLIFLIATFLIPIYFDELLRFLTTNLNSGWVFGSIYLRLIVIIFFSISLYLFFSMFKRTKKIKFLYVFLIAILPGFGISFIAPIYNVDYGMFEDDLKIDKINRLSDATNEEFNFNNERIILAFFTTTCPHCKAVCRKLSYNKKAGQKIDVHTFFPKNEENANVFLKENHGESFSSYIIESDQKFTEFAGTTYPSVYIIGPDGETEKHFTGDMINYTILDYLLELKPK